MNHHFESTPIEIGVLMLPGQVPLDVAGPLQVLLSAEQLGAPIHLHFFGPQPSLPWLGAMQLSGIKPLPREAIPLDLLLITGQYRLQADERDQQLAIDWLKYQASASRTLMAVCSGALLLGRAGLLDGLRCTTHHALVDELQKLAPRARVRSDCIFTEDANCLTSAGISTGIDTMLHWLGRTLGQHIAQQVARDLVLYWRRSGQEPQLSIWLEGRNHVDHRIHRLQDALAADLAHPWTLGEMATRSAMSERQLRRRFSALTGLSLMDYLMRLRLQLARQLMCETDWRLARIAEVSGFGDDRQLRRVWQRFETESPAMWRRLRER
ncbi:GlxA family transcriptional regulator [Kushneria phyllosphaerae]|uniref:HTH-type transcriptional regulator CdhR n=1 Tax=Kushneria phyllosphaerae TaxID=2100822 RepID=A0A2R8CHA0_9GAMM|nr:helix-turn-helix domain-containing protein [Kushneria phyllosphaerae]SPJ32278.1 HTH-type transcriptional regulator CdhR [Kushneria phyllosphaerae]